MAGRASAESRARLGGLLAHLRLHYQLLLAPIYLWGYFLTGAPVRADFWLGFAVFHVFLYGGATAYNSYYDRDQGPIGGRSIPPPVTDGLLGFSLRVQVVGAALAAAVNRTFLAIYLTMLVMGIAYSHPRVRLKARPLVGLATVALGQGVLACLGGWASAGVDLRAIDPVGWVGVAAAALVTVGFYPITQAYQIEEDRARGDITFAVWAGPRRAFVFAIAVQTMGAVLLGIAIADRLGLAWAALALGFYGVVMVAQAHLGRMFPRLPVLEQFERIMALNAVMSGGFLVFVAAHLFLAR
jgi:1,4-dihydroxy-2-naphthoate octaprenyltransferase